MSIDNQEIPLPGVILFLSCKVPLINNALQYSAYFSSDNTCNTMYCNAIYEIPCNNGDMSLNVTCFKATEKDMIFNKF